MTSYTIIGAILGGILALAGLQFGFGGFVLVLALIIIGAIIGRVLEGKLDIKAVVDALRGKRSSS